MNTYSSEPDCLTWFVVFSTKEPNQILHLFLRSSPGLLQQATWDPLLVLLSFQRCPDCKASPDIHVHITGTGGGQDESSGKFTERTRLLFNNAVRMNAAPQTDGQLRSYCWTETGSEIFWHLKTFLFFSLNKLVSGKIQLRFCSYPSLNFGKFLNKTNVYIFYVNL